MFIFHEYVRQHFKKSTRSEVYLHSIEPLLKKSSSYELISNNNFLINENQLSQHFP